MTPQPSPMRQAGVPDHRQFPSLDGYRAVAALAVLATHVGFQTAHSVNGTLGSAIGRLDLGVTFFFLLSGFLLYRPHAVAAMAGTPAPSAGPYLWRRLLRIAPAYWVAVLLALLLVRSNDAESLTATDWLVQLLLVQVYVPDGLVPGLSQMWSLAVEVAFYLTLPWLAAFATRQHRGTAASGPAQLRTLGAFVVVAWLWNAAIILIDHPLADLADLWLPAYLDWFAVGMALAVVQAWPARHAPTVGVNTLRTLAAAPWTCWTVAGGLFLIATTPVAGPVTLVAPTPGQAIVKHLLYAAIATAVLLPAFLGGQADGPNRWLGHPLARWLGTISYGIFLYHLVVLDLVFAWQGRDFFTGGFLAVLWPTVLGSIVVAAISWYALEQPMMRLRSRGPGRHRQHGDDAEQPGGTEQLRDEGVRA